jgi:outer membrane protein
MKFFYISTMLIALLFSKISAAEDLMQVYAMAFKSDPQLLAEAASRRAVSELDDQATANFLPQVGLTANTDRVNQDTSTQMTSSDFDYNTHGYSISITQPVFRKENFVQLSQAEIAIESAQASYLVKEQQLIVRVALAYFGLLARIDDLSFTEAEREAIALQLEQTNQRFEVGMVTITDVVESKAAYDIANAAVIDAENEVANSKERLRETTGLYIDELAALKDESPLVSPEPQDINQWSELALQQNPSLFVARSNIENAKQEIALQKSGHYPSLDLVGEKRYRSQNDDIFDGYSNTHQDSISLQFNVPLYEGGSVNSRTREAGYRLDQAMQNEEEQLRAVKRQTREAYNSVMSGISRVKALKQAVISSEKALESTEAGYEVGNRTTVDVLNVRRSLFSARRDYAAARYEYIVDTLNLKQAAGTVSVDDLSRINQWLGG